MKNQLAIMCMYYPFRLGMKNRITVYDGQFRSDLTSFGFVTSLCNGNSVHIITTTLPSAVAKQTPGILLSIAGILLFMFT